MTGRMIELSLFLCVTAWGIVDGWAWYWIALNVAIDLWAVVGLIAAASRGRT